MCADSSFTHPFNAPTCFYLIHILSSYFLKPMELFLNFTRQYLCCASQQVLFGKSWMAVANFRVQRGRCEGQVARHSLKLEDNDQAVNMLNKQTDRGQIYISLVLPPPSLSVLLSLCLCVCLSWPVFLSVSLAAPFFLLALSVPCLGSSVPSDVFIAIHRHLCFATPPPLNQILPPYRFPSSTW